MRDLKPFDFVPDYQPDPDSTVTFRLAPLDQRGQFEIQGAMGPDLSLAWRGVEVAADYVVGWTGLKSQGIEVPFSRAAMRAVLRAAEPDMRWNIWLKTIAGKLYVDSLLTEIERKN